MYMNNIDLLKIVDVKHIKAFMMCLKVKINIFLLLLSFASCYQPERLTNISTNYRAYNFSSLYNPSESYLHPEYFIYLESENLAKFYFRIKTSELKKIRPNLSDDKTVLSIKYVLRDNENNEIADSSTYHVRFNLETKNEYIDTYFKVKIPEEKNYRISVFLKGETPKHSKRILAYIDNSNPYSQNHFLIKSIDSLQQNILTSNYVNTQKAYIIESENIDSLKIEFYKYSEYRVNLPYSSFKDIASAKADTCFRYKIGDSIIFANTGYYLLKNISDTQICFCLLSAGNSYPKILTVQDMIEPITLIATQREYDTISRSNNLKIAIDNFWFSKSNNENFAKEQIRIFYSRVSLANEYFTDTQQGWQTDRGNIYIIFGPPPTVNISDKGEEWFYGQNPDVASVIFSFEKDFNSVSTNTYRLLRDTQYQTIWAQAVNTWRNGKIFSLN